MIPQIQEINFPSYATLHQATVNFATMGDRTISTQVRIDGDIVPEFGVTENGVFKPMELVFRGERFILPVREPQARKDNSTRNSLIDLNFQSWVVYQLKRYYFVEMASTTSGTAIADKYEASLVLNLENFVDAFNLVLDHYFNGEIQISLFQQGQNIYPTDTVAIEINYSKIWDVLQKVYELYNVRWWIEYNSTTHTYYIMMGYESPAIDDHDFSYGYQGGLVSFERQVQEEVTNILLGRGGEKNLPYRYFKRVDEQNPGWTADPDAIPELANIYFDRLRDINFRWYVRGWMQNSHRDKTWENAGYTYPTYSISQSSPYYWAYQKGLTDTKFDPVEYVQDTDSIDIYGEMWGALDNNDDIYPTIQGVNPPNDNPDVGSVDEVVGVSQIVTDDIQEYSRNAAIDKTLKEVVTSLRVDSRTNYVLYSDKFTIATGDTGNITYRPLAKETRNPGHVAYNTSATTVQVIDASSEDPVTVSGQFDESTMTGAIAGIPAGTYRLKVNLVLTFSSPTTTASGTFGIENVVLTTSAINTEAWKPTFDIWVKNIWGTTQGNDSDQAYSERVWGPILGDRAGNQAKLVFSTGPMSISQDYEFTIASYPVPDRTRTYNGVTSEWRITVYKCDAEYQTTGLYIPNASSAQPTAGNKFFFTGIDMPFQYVQWAEERLSAYKATQLEDMSDVATTWALKLDKVRVHTLEEADYGQLLADRLDSGVLINTTDPRFTHGNVLSLYIQSITWTWNEPTDDNPYLVPDIEVVLADKIVAVKSPISQLTDEVSVISATYVQTPDVESVVRRVAGALYLKKTGESDSSASPTSFASKVSSVGFRKGSIGGQGWGFYEDNAQVYDVPEISGLVDDGSAETKSVLEIDKLVVRDELQVNELVVNQITYQGGNEIISAAAMEISMVRETTDSYVCYFDQKQSTVANLFAVNDIAYGQVWNPDNTELRTYKMVVTAVATDSITLSKASKTGDGVPQAGDKVVQYGNTTNTNRQYVIIRNIIGGGYERMLSGLNSTSATGTEYYFAGRQGTSSPRWFVGNASGEYAEWVDGQLNIKGSILVKNSAGTYTPMANALADLNYLTTALPESSTLITGGLILSKVIALTDANNNVMSGINGVPSLSNIAAWYGGPMADRMATPTPSSYAQTLFRFDGSGYLAGGDIYWDQSGNGGIPGITWDSQNVIIGSEVKLESSSGQAVVGLVDAVRLLLDMFEDETYTENNTVKHRIKVGSGFQGFYTDGFLSAGGLSNSGGSSGTDLQAVWASLSGSTVDAYANTQIAASHLLGYATTSDLTGKENSSNKVTSLTASSTNAQYPSAKCVYDALAEKQATLTAGTGITITNNVISATGLTGDYIPLSGSSVIEGSLSPNSNAAYDLGSSSYKWRYIYGTYLSISSLAVVNGGLKISGGSSVNSTFYVSNNKLHVYPEMVFDNNTFFSGNYNDLTNKPDLSSYVTASSLATVATTGSYNDLTNRPDLSVYVTLTGTQTISGIKTFSSGLNITGGTSSRTLYIDSNGALHCTVPFISDSYISAGGASSGGGSAGTDLNAVWNSLKYNSDSHANETINTAHIPDLSNIYQPKFAFTVSGTSGSTYNLATISSNATNGNTAYGWGNHANAGYLLASNAKITINGTQVSSGGSFNTASITAGTAGTSSATSSLQSLSVPYVKLNAYGIVTAYGTHTHTLMGSSSVGGTTQPVYYNGSAFASTTYSLSASVNSGTSGKLAYYSGANAISSYTSTVGSASKPVWFNGGTITEITASSLFSALSSSASTNLSMTIAGQERTATLYATYDTNSENIATNMGIIGNALKSLQSQIDSVASRDGFETLTAMDATLDSLSVARKAFFGSDICLMSEAYINLTSDLTSSEGDWIGYDSGDEEIAFDFVHNCHFYTGLYSDSYITAGASGSSSDRRLKNDLERISAERAWDVLKQLKPMEWVWNEKNAYLSGKRGAGLVAQDVSEVLPFAVMEGGEYLSLNYPIMHAYEIAGLQDHESRIEGLENEVKRLTMENMELKNKLEIRI